jgi:hypothetical protein
MSKSKTLSIELDVNEIQLPIIYQKVNIGEVMTKYNFSIVEKSNEEKLIMVAKELLESDSILIGFACFNLKEIIQIDNHLRESNSSLNTVFIPSAERMERRKVEAMENAKLHERWLGYSAEDVQKNFNEFRANLQEIKDGLKNTTIQVKEV